MHSWILPSEAAIYLCILGCCPVRQLYLCTPRSCRLRHLSIFALLYHAVECCFNEMPLSLCYLLLCEYFTVRSLPFSLRPAFCAVFAATRVPCHFHCTGCSCSSSQKANIYQCTPGSCRKEQQHTYLAIQGNKLSSTTKFCCRIQISFIGLAQSWATPRD